MRFNTDVSVSSVDPFEGYNTMQSNRASQRNYNDAGISTGAPLADMDLVGMNASNVGPAITAIEDYVERINGAVDTFVENADSDMAFKGEEINSALTAYMTSVKTYCKNLSSQFNAFAGKLQDAQNQWEAFASNASSNINNAANNYETGTYNSGV